MPSPDLTQFLSQQSRQALPSELAYRAGVDTNQGPISYNPSVGTKEWTLGYQAGSTLPNMAQQRGLLRPLRPIIDNLGTNTGASALTGAGLGGALGAGKALMTGGDVGKNTAVGAGLGAAGMLLLSAFAKNRLNNTQWSQTALPEPPGRVKSSFYVAQSSATADLRNKLMQDSALGNADKTTLLNYVSQLSDNQKQDLSRLIGPVAGAGLGIVIARYLLGLGFGGTALLAIIGGAVGNSLAGSRDAYGQRIDTGHDMFGQARFV